VTLFSKLFTHPKSTSFNRRLSQQRKVLDFAAQYDTKHADLPREILRASQILNKMAQAHAMEKGAVGLELGDEAGHKEMVDAPMVKQVTLLDPWSHSFV
jgi:hypothetical protein